MEKEDKKKGHGMSPRVVEEVIIKHRKKGRGKKIKSKIQV
jgi:hypothetical protein